MCVYVCVYIISMSAGGPIDMCIFVLVRFGN